MGIRSDSERRESLLGRSPAADYPDAAGRNEPGQAAHGSGGQRHDREGVGVAIAKTEAFVREQLGDVRSFSLDSPASRKPKIEALRAAMRN